MPRERNSGRTWCDRPDSRAASEAFLLYRWSFGTAKASFGLVDLAMHGSLIEAWAPRGASPSTRVSSIQKDARSASPCPKERSCRTSRRRCRAESSTPWTRLRESTPRRSSTRPDGSILPCNAGLGERAQRRRTSSGADGALCARRGADRGRHCRTESGKPRAVTLRARAVPRRRRPALRRCAQPRRWPLDGCRVPGWRSGHVDEGDASPRTAPLCARDARPLNGLRLEVLTHPQRFTSFGCSCSRLDEVGGVERLNPSRYPPTHGPRQNEHTRIAKKPPWTAVTA
jgi:hypothetical protein